MKKKEQGSKTGSEKETESSFKCVLFDPKMGETNSWLGEMCIFINAIYN